MKGSFSFALLLCLSVCVCILADKVSFKGNVSTEHSNDHQKVALDYDLQYRKTVVSVLPPSAPSLPYGAILFKSYAVTGTDSHGDEIPPNKKDKRSDEGSKSSSEGDNSEASSNASSDDDSGDDSGDDDSVRTKSVTLVGGACVTEDHYFTTYIAGYKVNDNNVDKFRQYNSEVSSALGVIISALYGMQELDEHGNTYKNVSLTGLSWSFSSVQTDSTGALFTVTATGTDPQSPLTFTITFLFSSVVGTTNMSDAVVTPKTIESVINVTGYELAAPDHSIALVFLVGAGDRRVQSGKGIIDGISFISGNFSDGSQVFFSLSNVCYVNNTQESVTIQSYNVSSDDYAFTNIPIFAGVKGRYKNHMTYHLFRAVFPAGATNFSYDPTTGAGQVTTDAAITGSNSALSLTASGVGMVWVVVVAVLLMFV